MNRLKSMVAAGAVIAVTAQAATCPVRAQWPTQDWVSIAAQVAPNKAAQIQALEQFAFTLTGTDAQRLGYRTDALLIVHGGQIIYERYARGFAASNRHYTWSVTKSFVNALAAIAVGLGALTVNDSICKYIPGLPADHCAVTVQHLLEFSSGLDWDEGYETSASNQNSSVLAMLYGVGHRDMSAFVASHPIATPPGSAFLYSSGETTLLAHVVNTAVLTRPLIQNPDARWPWTLLFTPIGMRSVIFETDPQGTPVGGSYLYATPRDLAKFGFLFLNDGCWDGQRILPDGWVNSSTAATAVSQGQQGRQWWLNKSTPPAFPDVPADAYCAEGHWGQSICNIPSLDLVIVRLGDDRQGSMDLNMLMKLAAAVGS